MIQPELDWLAKGQTDGSSRVAVMAVEPWSLVRHLVLHKSKLKKAKDLRIEMLNNAALLERLVVQQP